VDISGRIVSKFYVSVYFGPPEYRKSSCKCSCVFWRLYKTLSLDSLLVNWQTITGTCGGLLQFLLKFEIVSKIF
jgi:hypothetical protein